MGTESENSVGTVFVVLGVILLAFFVIYIFSVWVYPKIKKGVLFEDKIDTVKNTVAPLCFYSQVESGIAETILDSANIVKFEDNRQVSPLMIAENMTKCFPERPRICVEAATDGSCLREETWDGKMNVSYDATCPFNSEENGLQGHIVCLPDCENFTSGKNYKIQVATTLSSHSAPLPDFCMFYSEARAT